MNSSGSFDGLPSLLIEANSIGITQLNVSDGSSGQVLKTDGSGTLTFQNESGGGGSSLNVIEYVTIATAGNASDFGDLTAATYSANNGVVSSSTRGL